MTLKQATKLAAKLEELSVKDGGMALIKEHLSGIMSHANVTYFEAMLFIGVEKTRLINDLKEIRLAPPARSAAGRAGKTRKHKVA